MNNERPFQDMTALVTGASTGIGAATAMSLAKSGANVIIHYNSNAAAAQRVADEVQACGVQADLVQADLSTRKGCNVLIRFIRDRTIDILVNNAGSLIARTRVLDFTEELWDRVMMLNLTSAFFLAQAVLWKMVMRKSGVIINVGSVAAITGGGVGALAYASTKAAISTMTKGLTKEFAPLGIRVNAVSPGTVDTHYHEQFSTREGLEAVRAATPSGRIGSSQEIADVIVFLCSEEASFIHGQTIEVNGGFSMV